MVKKLVESLKKGDLNNLILDQISIDEYSSKIDDRKVIVVAIFTKHKDAAIDLCSFIEKSPVHILDVEVSSSPNKKAEWACFIEITRNKYFPKKFMQILDEISNLTNIEKWFFKTQNNNNLPCTLENITKNVNLDSKSIEILDDNLSDDNLSESILRIKKLSGI